MLEKLIKRDKTAVFCDQMTINGKRQFLDPRIDAVIGS